MTDSAKSEKFEIKKSESLVSHFATDAVVSGPTPDGLMHIGYLVDRVNPVSQSVLRRPVKSGPEHADGEEMSLYWGDDDVHIERCLVGQVSLTDRGAAALLTALMDRMWNSGSVVLIEETLAKLKTQSDPGATKE